MILFALLPLVAALLRHVCDVSFLNIVTAEHCAEHCALNIEWRISEYTSVSVSVNIVNICIFSDSLFFHLAAWQARFWKYLAQTSLVFRVSGSDVISAAV